MPFRKYRTGKDIPFHESSKSQEPKPKGTLFAGFEVLLEPSEIRAGWLADKNGDLYRNQDLEAVGTADLPGLSPDTLWGLSDQEIESRLGWAFSEWGVKNLWSHSMGKGITAAIIDSGIQQTHPGFRNTLFKDGRNFRGTDPTSMKDGLGHGSAVASVVAGAPDWTDSTTVPMALGIAPQIALLVARIDVVPPDAAQAALAVEWAQDSGADLILMSWGTRTLDTAFERAISKAVAAGTIVLASAGDDSSSTAVVQYPAHFAGVLTVGALQDPSTLSRHSPVNADIQLVAPGDRIHIAALPDQVGTQGSGTSFAVPLVAGVLAILLAWLRARQPALGRKECSQAVVGAVVKTAKKLLVDQNREGRGSVQPLAALASLQEDFS
jgi:subtilisin family serine protease